MSLETPTPPPKPSPLVPSKRQGPSVMTMLFRIALVVLLLVNAALMVRVLQVGAATQVSAEVASSPQAGKTRSGRSSSRKVEPRGDLASSEKTTVDIFRKSAPSVVHITSVALRGDWLKRNVMEIPRGTGSGFVWDDKGHIVTNFHVIQAGNSVKVRLEDQTEFDADVVGVAPFKDLAVLRIHTKDESLVPIAVGASNGLIVGQHVFAIGNPFGFDHTLSTGVISGLHREIMSVARRPIEDVIQTDAAINPGNSGGPLLDSAGRLIGVNTAIFSPSGTNAGIGFAVPVDIVRRIVPQLIEHGRVIRPWLGVQIADAQIAQRLGVEGVLVVGVMEGSPAAAAGLKPVRRDTRSGRFLLGDIIVGIDDADIKEPNDLFKALDKKRIGQTVSVKLKRGDSTRTEKLKLSEMPQQE